MRSSSEQTKLSLPPKTLFLGGILVLCALMCGAAIYAKYNLDLSENTLSAPDNAFTPEQNLYDRMVVSLGYGGFLGAAQEHIAKKDPTSLQDMRMHYKTAEESLLRAGDAASTPVRRDIRAILDLFAQIVSRAEEGDDALSSGLTTADLLAATSALTTLDARLASAMAVGRAKAQGSFRSWSSALIGFALSGLLLTMAMAGWTLWSTGGRRDEDLGTLAQSVTNLVHGDSQKPIWGIERTDKLGELARTIDLARMYFTQLPDLSVASEDGPVRMKFDGEAKSLFQSMMRKVTDAFERAQQTSLGLTGTMNAQQDLLKSLTAQLRVALEDLQRQGKNGFENVADLSKALSDAAISLARTEQEEARCLSDLVPFMKERIQGMAEVTHLAGSQVAQSLRELVKSEESLRRTAAQSQQTVKELSQTTGQMGERMAAALTFMQASSKALGETIDASRTRFNEAVDTLTRGETNMTKILSRAEQRLSSSAEIEEKMATLVSRTASGAEKLEKLVGAVTERHEHVDEQILTAAHRMDAIVANFEAAQRVLNDSAGQIRRDGALIGNVLSDLRANNDQLLATIGQNSQTSFTAAQNLAEKSHALMQRLEVQIAQQAQMAESRIDELTSCSHSLTQHASGATTSLSQTVQSLKSEQEKLAASRAKFSETLGELGLSLERHATTTFGKTETWAAESFAKISGLTEQMEGFMARLNMLGQLTGTLGTVAGQLGQIIPALTQTTLASDGKGVATLSTLSLDDTKALIVTQTESVIKELRGQWHQAVVQIEAMHEALAQIVRQQKDQLETRLVVMDKKLREATEATAEIEQRAALEEKQTEIINEVIAAVSKINAHVLELDEVVEEAGLKKEA